MPSDPSLSGAALVVGDNAIADEILRRLKSKGVSAEHIRAIDIEDLDTYLDRIWSSAPANHLFLTTCHDRDANWAVDDAVSFSARRDSALRVPYRICQRWMQGVIDAGEMDRSTLVTVVRGGGDFAIGSANPADRTIRRSNESGAMAGLTKAMLIEAWMRGFRDTPMLVIDSREGASSESTVNGIWKELCVPSYDEEVAVEDDQRLALASTYAPLPNRNLADAVSTTNYPLTRGGNWIVAGGGRGITAMTAMELAERHDLTLQLLGMAPPPQIDASTREHAIRDRADLRRATMRRVQASGQNPVKHWRQMEKAIEIDLTLAECERRGIRAKYHSVNVSDPNAVAVVVDGIRRSDGPIRGVIQGAGSGQDARFDRKRAEKVDQCLSAKIDGTVSLAAATRQDPLEWFVGFGSISGRFGANGHTDYSAANDMLSKLIGDLGRRRPETRCVTFHWHAWGDIGMATKPEAKLALDMIGMKFMPAREGLMHFLNEIELGGDCSEVLITDRRYVRKFFPCGEDDKPFVAPLLMSNRRSDDDSLPSDPASFTMTLEPTRDLFLKEHLVGGKPTLPMVIATEAMAQAASIAMISSGLPEQQRSVVAITGLRAIQPLKSTSDDAYAVELIRDSDHPASWSLACDLRRKDGRLVEAARKHFAASFEFGDPLDCPKVNPAEHLRSHDLSQPEVEYLPSDSPVYHGPPLRCLRSIGFSVDPESANVPLAVGTIVAPSPAHLAGEERALTGWITSPATMDAVLYAAGMLAGHVGQRPSLPVSIDRIDLGRLPQPGEPLRVVLKWLTDLGDGSGGVLSAVLAGQNDDLIARLTGYRVGWLA